MPPVDFEYLGELHILSMKKSELRQGSLNHLVGGSNNANAW